MLANAGVRQEEHRAVRERGGIAPSDPKQAAEFAAALARLRQRQAEMEAAGRDPLLALAGTWRGTPQEHARLLAEIEEIRHSE